MSILEHVGASIALVMAVLSGMLTFKHYSDRKSRKYIVDCEFEPLYRGLAVGRDAILENMTGGVYITVRLSTGHNPWNNVVIRSNSRILELPPEKRQQIILWYLLDKGLLSSGTSSIEYFTSEQKHEHVPYISHEKQVLPVKVLRIDVPAHHIPVDYHRNSVVVSAKPFVGQIIEPNGVIMSFNSRHNLAFHDITIDDLKREIFEINIKKHLPMAVHIMDVEEHHVIDSTDIDFYTVSYVEIGEVF